jgi:hypothetical protein
MNAFLPGLLGCVRKLAKNVRVAGITGLFGLLVITSTSAQADAGLLTYSLSAVPVTVSTLWNASALSYSQIRARQNAIDSDSPLWARAGARELQTALNTAAKSKAGASILDMNFLHTVRPGIGDLFDYDQAGRVKLGGTATEDTRWYYLKFRVFGDRKK